MTARWCARSDQPLPPAALGVRVRHYPRCLCRYHPRADLGHPPAHGRGRGRAGLPGDRARRRGQLLIRAGRGRGNCSEQMRPGKI
jgi:hypothetical protein